MEPKQRWQAFLNVIGGEILQEPTEVEVLYRLVEAIEPRGFVEIGSAHGGTLVIYAGACTPGATVIAVDDGRNISQAAQLERSMQWLKAEGFEAHWLRGDSHAGETVEQLRDLLAGRPVDFLHIDGDHREEGALADWRMYGPLVRPGGLVAFHDIAFEPEPGARAAWDQIKRQPSVASGGGGAWVELIGPPGRVSGGGEALYRLGVGVLWKT